MKVTEVRFGAQLPVDSYGPGFFRVKGEVIKSGVMIFASGVVEWSGYDDLSPLQDHADEYDVVFIGTGADIAPLPAEITAELTQREIAFDVMSSPSAARMYNVLLSEDRRVALAVLPV